VNGAQYWFRKWIFVFLIHKKYKYIHSPNQYCAPFTFWLGYLSARCARSTCLRQGGNRNQNVHYAVLTMHGSFRVLKPNLTIVMKPKMGMRSSGVTEKLTQVASLKMALIWKWRHWKVDLSQVASNGVSGVRKWRVFPRSGVKWRWSGVDKMASCICLTWVASSGVFYH